MKRLAACRNVPRAGDMNRYGEPNFRVVWGGSRLAWIGGRWTDRCRTRRVATTNIASRAKALAANSSQAGCRVKTRRSKKQFKLHLQKGKTLNALLGQGIHRDILVDTQPKATRLRP
jgi:hypothetical protein